MSQELALSELANRLKVKHSSADTPTDIANRIEAKFDSAQPLALSERAMGQTRELRKLKILRLSEGDNPRINPVIAKHLNETFCSDDLVLSEGQEDGFDAVMDVLELLDSRQMKSVTKGQTLRLSEGNRDEKKPSKLVEEMKSRNKGAN